MGLILKTLITSLQNRPTYMKQQPRKLLVSTYALTFYSGHFLWIGADDDHHHDINVQIIPNTFMSMRVTIKLMSLKEQMPLTLRGRTTLRLFGGVEY